MYGQIDPNGPLPLSKKVSYYEKRIAELSNGPASTEKKIKLFTDLAKSYLKEKQYDLALNNLLKAKVLNPTDDPKLGVYYSPFAILFGETGALNLAKFYQKKILFRERSALSRFYACSAIGSIFLSINETDSAHYYFNMQLKIANEMDDFMAVASSLNNNGLVYLQEKNAKQALEVFNQVKSILIQHKSTNSKNFNGEKREFENLVEENIGRTYFLMKDYSTAASKFDTCYTYLGTKQLTSNHLLWFKALLFSGQLQKALLLKQRFQPLIQQSTIETQIIWDRLNIELAIFQSNVSSIKFWMTQLQADRDQQSYLIKKGTAELNQLLSVYTISEAKQFIENEKEKRKNADKQLKLERTTTLFTIIFSFISFVFFVLGFFVYYQFSKNKRKRIELEKQELELKSKTQENFLTEYALDYNKNLELDKQLVQEIQRIAELENDTIGKELKTLMAEIKQKVFNESKTVELIKNSEQLLNEFNLLLLSRHPNLKKNEIYLCQLIRLDLSNKEIATIKNVTPESIKIFKNRLKHKLQIDKSLSIADYLKSLG